jgi:hypothetical protein
MTGYPATFGFLAGEVTGRATGMTQPSEPGADRRQ